MNTIYSAIQDRMAYIDDILAYSNQVLSSAPEGRLRATKSKNYILYYQRTDPTSANGKYLKKSEDAMVQALAQKEYLEKVSKRACHERELLSPLLAFYQNTPMETASEDMHVLKRPKIQPIFSFRRGICQKLANAGICPKSSSWG